MVAAVGMGAYVAGMFHLVTHAFFKALLFLSAGSVILGMERGHHHLEHGHDGEHGKVKGRRKREIAGREHEEKYLTRTTCATWADCARSCRSRSGCIWPARWPYRALFPLQAFGQKMKSWRMPPREGFTAVYWLLAIAAFFTAFYMGRQIWMVFFGEPRHAAAAQAEESPSVITVPLIILAFLALFGGALNLPGLHTLTGWLEHTIDVHPSEFVWSVAIISTVLALLALFVSWLIYGRNPLKAGEIDPLKKPLGFFFTGAENKWYVDELYQAIFITPFVQTHSLPGGRDRLALLA